MLWQHYVYRRGNDVDDLWDHLLSNRPIKLLYITGHGFDIRARITLRRFLDNIKANSHRIESAELLLVKPENYFLSEELKELTRENTQAIRYVTEESLDTEDYQGEEPTASQALRLGIKSILSHIDNQTDIILDVSSIPRIGYLAILTSLLKHIIPDVNMSQPLRANNVNFQVIVAEDSILDSKIQSEDPSDSLVSIPGFSAILHAESVRDWPLVWFPVLGENRSGQFERVSTLAGIQSSDEIVPVLPHPSINPRRADDLLIEYQQQLFGTLFTPLSNVMFAHESHPFEAYRQLLGAMKRYVNSLSVLGGCRLLVTPLGSKMITVAVGLACFEMRNDSFATYGVGIPYVNPNRYVATRSDIENTNPILSVLLLTGVAYGTL